MIEDFHASHGHFDLIMIKLSHVGRSHLREDKAAQGVTVVVGVQAVDLKFLDRNVQVQRSVFVSFTVQDVGGAVPLELR